MNNYVHQKPVKRIFFIIFLFLFTFTSFSVYAKNNVKMTKTQPPSEGFFTDTETADTNDPVVLAPAVYLAENNIIVPDDSVPLVQSLMQTHASPSLLYQEADVDTFYENTVFVGDSISVGFSQYYAKNSSLFTDTTYFLAKESCSAQVTISPNALTQHKDIMPAYNGSVQYIEDSISQMEGIEKVFICFGINDLVVSTPQEYVSNMETLVNRILTKSPDVTIYLISIPCIIEDTQAGLLSNASIQEANSLLQSACEAAGWGFVNLTEYLMNENLAIRIEYSSDGYVHENSNAYEVWVRVLRNYAYEHRQLTAAAIENVAKGGF